MNPTQSNTQERHINHRALEDLTGKEGFLAVLTVDGNGKTVARLPNGNNELAPYLVDDGDAAGNVVSLEALSPERNRRIKAKGAGAAGSQLILADVAVAADRGKVRVVPGAAGTYNIVAVAEESFVDGQLVLCRPLPGVNLFTK